jgi:16S rRNA processing protein RimM
MTGTGRPDGLLEIGRVGRAHGVRGEVYVDLTTDRYERLAPGARVWARSAWLTVARSRPQPHAGRFLVTFEGIDQRAAAEKLTNATLHAEPIHDPEALWVHELIGSDVVEVDGTRRGRCVAVVDNPAADLLELDTGALVPIVFVVSSAAGVVTIDPPAGLFDVE